MPILALLLALAQQTAPGTAAAPVPAPAAPTMASSGGAKGSADEVVCKRDAVTGSRLPAAKVCRTRGEWADMAAQAREATQQVQNQRSFTPH